MVKVQSLAAFGLAAVTLLAACANPRAGVSDESGEPQKYPVEKVIEGLVYTPPDWPQALEADLYMPARDGLRPVVLMVHGGSWSGRDRQDMNDVSQTLARHGYAVLNLGYRFAPAYQYPAQLLDLRQALNWVTQNAARYALDRSRINAWGYSSGAHLAALLASYNYSESSLVKQDGETPSIRAVVAGGIPADLRKYADGPIVNRFLGGSRKQLPDVYADASPAFHISPEDPPVFLFHGKLDALVSVDQATDYHRALVEQGVDAELHLNPFLGHTTLFVFGGEAERKAIDFLNRKNALPDMAQG